MSAHFDRLAKLYDEEIAGLHEELQAANERISQLEHDSLFLDALRQAGVDNWPGYEVAQDLYDEMTTAT